MGADIAASLSGIHSCRDPFIGLWRIDSAKTRNLTSGALTTKFASFAPQSRTMTTICRRGVSVGHDHPNTGAADARVTAAMGDGVLPAAYRSVPRLHDE